MSRSILILPGNTENHDYSQMESAPSLHGMTRPQPPEVHDRCFMVILLFRTIIAQKLCLYGILVSLIPISLENLRETPPRERKRVVGIDMTG